MTQFPILSFVSCTAVRAKGILIGAKRKKQKKPKEHGFQIRMIQKPKEFGKGFVHAKLQMQNMMESGRASNSGC